MWVEKLNPDVDGKRDIQLGEVLRGISPHPRTRYAGHGEIGNDSQEFIDTGEICTHDTARVVRKWTTRTPNRLGGISYVGFGLAICECIDPDCQYPIPVAISGRSTLTRQ